MSDLLVVDGESQKLVANPHYTILLRILAALNKEKCEENPRSNLAQNSNVPRSQKDYITQVSEEIEGRVTKKLC